MLLGGVVQAAHRAGELAERCQGNVLTYRHYRHDTVFFAVFRHHGDAVANGLLTVSDADRLAINKNLPLPAPRPDAEQALHRLGPSGADQPGDAEDFPATQGKRDVVDPFNMTVYRVPGGQVFDPQDLLAVGVRFAGIERGELPANHHGDDVVFAHAAGVASADVLAVADHADCIGDRFDLIELVRNIDAGDIVVLQIANDRQQRRGLLFG